MNSKSANIAKDIAKELLACKLDDKIPTVSNLSSKYRVGIGTIDKIFNNFKENNIIELQPRGQMGTYLISKDFIKLCEIAGSSMFIGLLPLPNSIEYEALATGLNDSFRDKNISFSLNFKNGANERLNSLLNNRSDFIVMSSHAADKFTAEKDDVIKLVELTKCNYYSNFYLIYNRKLKKEKNEWRIGMDKNSSDNVFFTQKVFSNNTKVNLNYYNFPYAIVDGKIDAAVIHSKTFIPLELINMIEIEKVNFREDEGFNNRFNSVILTKKDKIDIITLFSEILDLSLIEKGFLDVLDRKIEPSF